MSNSNTKYSYVDKVVRMAYSIGGEKGWTSGNSKVFDLMRNASNLFRGGKTSDKDNRSYFELMFDYQKDSSLFNGEAMQKAEKYIQARINRFGETCSTVLDILNAHLAVCDLTADQVKNMDPVTRQMYDEIKSDRSAVEAKIQFVTDIFTKPLTTSDIKGKEKVLAKSIFESADNYYKKDKTVYIDKGHNGAGIDLKDKLVARKDTEYQNRLHQNHGYAVIEHNGKYTYFHFAKGYVRKDVNNDLKKSKLSRDDIIKIAKQARSLNMTIKDYLAYCGFDVTDLKRGDILVSRGYAIGDGDYEGAGASGYTVTTQKPIEENVKMVNVHFENTDRNFFFFDAE
jgi:hypothetical protein